MVSLISLAEKRDKCLCAAGAAETNDTRRET